MTKGTSHGAYKVTEDFENEVARYTGAPFAVSFDSCSNAIKACLAYERIKGWNIAIPKHTYISVPCEIILSGNEVEWIDSAAILTGRYLLGNTRIWDSALTFTANMYMPYMLMCLSFSGPYKHLKLGKGGMILCGCEVEAEWFKKYRFSGRNECSYHEDTFTMLGGNYYLLPELAAKGLRDMAQFWNLDGTPKHNEDLSLPYPDLSKFPIYDSNNR